MRPVVDGDRPAPQVTEQVTPDAYDGVIRRFTLLVVGSGAAAVAAAGEDKGTPWQSRGERSMIGSAEGCDLVIDDRTVSRYHCEIVVGEGGPRVIDAGSRNGTMVDGVRVREAYLRDGSMLRLGNVSVRFTLGPGVNTVAHSRRSEFGGLVGRSPAMRATFALLERAAATDTTVLLEGETGTGKGVAAEAVHAASTRRDKPFVIVDCGAIAANLLESELFGHEKGSFTGADARRIGAFEEADGGTIFLDEIGELPTDLQPKLLRVLESRTIRRIGQNQHRPVDVRLIAATHRDLRAEVNAGRFRADLYYRLAVLRVPMPSLRERPDDLPMIAERILSSLGASPPVREKLLTLELLETIQRAAWPGNVRELRNYLERCMVFEGPQPTESGPAKSSQLAIDVSRPLAEERQRVIDEFERGYVEEILRAHGGKVVQAAAAAKVGRVHLYRMMRRLGITK